jgi:heparan-alpha-glucosaminide N-acetyltransferase
MIKTTTRLESIDVFRALTMLLMVFVNDLDPMPNVPEWIKHVGENADGLGFADTIFPAFLFIVGLSIPLALRNRIQKGDSTMKLVQYIGIRAFALIVMGFFHVNLEDYKISAALLPKSVWEIGITVSFFLIWLDYPRDMNPRKRLACQWGGVLLLLLMAILYKGGESNEIEWLRPQWWGILGLIGWSYLVCALLFLFTKGRLWIQTTAMLFFLFFDCAAHLGWLQALSPIHHYVWIVGNGAMPALTMGGVMVTVIYLDGIGKTKKGVLLPLLILIGGAMIGLGFLLRPIGGISKIHDTPSWVSICMGIAIVVYAIMIYLVDWKGKKNWFRFIMPAGTSTLTCYLVPYLLYSIYGLFHFKFPYPFNEGTGGLFKSIVTAIVVVMITGWLEKRRLRLKV